MSMEAGCPPGESHVSTLGRQKRRGFEALLEELTAFDEPTNHPTPKPSPG
jgi:hypothetical protein